MKVYLLMRGDGSVAIMRCQDDTTPEAEVAKWDSERQASIAEIKEITEADLPKDRTFRDAWSHKNPAKPIEVDMDKAKKVWRDKIREARFLRFPGLDVEYMKAEERRDEARKAEIVERKKLLRDLPQDPRIEQAKSVEELKAVWLPEPLPTVEVATPPPSETPPQTVPQEEPPKKEDKK